MTPIAEPVSRAPGTRLLHLRAAAAALVLLPVLAIAGHPIDASPLNIALAGLLAIAGASAVRWLLRDSVTSVIAGTAAIALGAWLLRYASYPGSGQVVAILIGAGAGLVTTRSVERRLLRPFLAALAAAALLVAVRVFLGAAEVAAAGTLLAIATAASVLWWERPRARLGRRTAWTAAGLAVYSAFAIFWVGSTAPGVTWFGSLTAHGPRSRSQVAITFDDGPNPPYTEQVAAILEQHGAVGTFFEVGKAVEKAPETTKRLYASGHLIGNHSYAHGAFSYLNPRYPELATGERAIFTASGVCPAIFRPPHGTHTPFMSHKVTDAKMRLVNWDVSAKDWSESDPARLARNIVRKAQPGSIILLHDGMDGNIGADRSVVVTALPAILDGLKAKGLEVVRLDVLLGIGTPYLAC